MQPSDGIAILALIVAAGSFCYTWYRDRRSRQARLAFRLNVDRSYKFTTDDRGVTRIVEENPPKTKFLVRNMSSRPTAIVEISAGNPSGAVLLDVDGQTPGGRMPVSVEPWGVKIFENTWPPGEHTEEMFFQIKDIDDKEYKVKERKVNRRLKPGDNPFEVVGKATAYENAQGRLWRRRS